MVYLILNSMRTINWKACVSNWLICNRSMELLMPNNSRYSLLSGMTSIENSPVAAGERQANKMKMSNHQCCRRNCHGVAEWLSSAAGDNASTHIGTSCTRNNATIVLIMINRTACSGRLLSKLVERRHLRRTIAKNGDSSDNLGDVVPASFLRRCS